MNRFDLEQKINETHNFIDQLNDISYAVLENELSQNETSDAIHGVAILLKLHTQKLFDVYKKIFSLDEYRDDLK